MENSPALERILKKATRLKTDAEVRQRRNYRVALLSLFFFTYVGYFLYLMYVGRFFETTSKSFLVNWALNILYVGYWIAGGLVLMTMAGTQWISHRAIADSDKHAKAMRLASKSGHAAKVQTAVLRLSRDMYVFDYDQMVAARKSQKREDAMKRNRAELDAAKSRAQSLKS